jgi:hypothetical protein
MNFSVTILQNHRPLHFPFFRSGLKVRDRFIHVPSSPLFEWPWKSGTFWIANGDIEVVWVDWARLIGDWKTMAVPLSTGETADRPDLLTYRLGKKFRVFWKRVIVRTFSWRRLGIWVILSSIVWCLLIWYNAGSYFSAWVGTYWL